MILEFLLRSISVLQLPKRPFIDNVDVTRIVKQARSDPRLQMASETKKDASKTHNTQKRKRGKERNWIYAYFGQKPSTKADTADLLRPIRETGVERKSSGNETSKESEHAPII